jgi:hypothetical protein
MKCADRRNLLTLRLAPRRIEDGVVDLHHLGSAASDFPCEFRDLAFDAGPLVEKARDDRRIFR